jgi:general secretion pathway protein H
MRGFTLLELLVVLLLIGIITSMAMLSITLTGRGDRIDGEAQRLTALMRLATDEAVLRTEELALRFDTGNYLFLRYNGDTWEEYADQPLTGHLLPDDIEVVLLLEGHDVVLGESSIEEDNKDDKQQASLKPQILFLSSGEITPFEITLIDRAGDLRRLIKGNLLGDISLSDPAHDERS